MNEPLTVEMRKRVAEACTGHKWKILASRIYRTINIPESLIIEWDTVANLTDILTLIAKAAQLIAEHRKVVHENFDEYSDRGIYFVQELQARLCDALAENNVPEIERMAWELLEGK